MLSDGHRETNNSNEVGCAQCRPPLVSRGVTQKGDTRVLGVVSEEVDVRKSPIAKSSCNFECNDSNPVRPDTRYGFLNKPGVSAVGSPGGRTVRG